MTDANFRIQFFCDQGPHQGSANPKSTRAGFFCKYGMSPNFRNVHFLETKAPAGAHLMQKRVWQFTLIKLVQFFQKSGQVGISQTSIIWWKFTYQNSLLTENLNGPYGPYEQLLWDISPNKWPKHRVFDANSPLWKITMSKIFGNAVFGHKKLCGWSDSGWSDSKTKVAIIVRHIPD